MSFFGLEFFSKFPKKACIMQLNSMSVEILTYVTDEDYVDVFLFCRRGLDLDWLHFCFWFGGWDLRTSAGPALGHGHVLVLRGGGGRLARRLKAQNSSCNM